MSLLPNVEVVTIGVDGTKSITKDHNLYNYSIYYPMNRALDSVTPNEPYIEYIPQIGKIICIYRNDNEEYIKKSVNLIMTYCKENNYSHVAFDEEELKMCNLDSIFEEFDGIEVDITIEK